MKTGKKIKIFLNPKLKIYVKNARKSVGERGGDLHIYMFTRNEKKVLECN